jgi:aminomethyltransferase
LSGVLRTTPLLSLHEERGARMVPFAGYLMPLQYPSGIIAEHLHTRSQAGLFDVSHMGQAILVGAGAIACLEALCPTDLTGLPVGRQRYSLLTAPDGGIVDDFMVARISEEDLFLVVNAACKETDFHHVAANAPDGTVLHRLESHALLALQGPAAAAVLARLIPRIAEMRFMDLQEVRIPEVGACRITRSGYTGEDGFEISVPSETALHFARRLLAEPEVALIGLGARDSLRLEAGLPLYGSDIDLTTSPVEANLGFAINKRRRAAWDFPGGEVMRKQLEQGIERVRVGLLPEGRIPARAGARITLPDGTPVGQVTSGGFGPSAQGPIAMGYVSSSAADEAPLLHLIVRDRPIPARVVPTAFIPHRYVR